MSSREGNNSRKKYFDDQLSGSPPTVSFSFKYLKRGTNKFPLSPSGASSYYSCLLERLQDLSTMTVSEIMNSRSPSLRCHPIDWDDPNVTEKCFGFPNEEVIVDTPYQISVSSNKYGRIHGFFIGNVFYVVWLDPEHNLYKRKRKK